MGVLVHTRLRLQEKLIMEWMRIPFEYLPVTDFALQPKVNNIP
jgi:hypothetical protein